MEANYVKHVLFVCLGNICRSPLAQGILDDLLQKKELHHYVFTDSAGTSNWHAGESPDARTCQNAKTHGLTLPYKARQVRSSDFDIFDYILVMDDSNYEHLMEWKPKDTPTKAEIYKMRAFDLSHPNADVPDPYFGGADGFENVYQILHRSVSHFLESTLIHQLPHSS